MGKPLQKSNRNYLLDLLKLIFAVLCTCAHIGNIFVRALFDVQTSGAAVLNPRAVGSRGFVNSVEIFGITGTATIAIFTFLTGYWLMQAFKAYQKRNWIGKGQDMALIGKYAAKTYASYWPYLLSGTAFGFVFLHLVIPGLRNLRTVIGNFVTSIPQFLGIFHLGYDPDNTLFTMNVADIVTYTENFSVSAENVLFKWNSGPLWYMFALVICAVIFFALLVCNEKISVYVVAPILFTLYNMETSVAQISGLEHFGLNIKWIHLAGPMMLGIWGWYLVDWLKKLEISKAGKRGLNVLAIATVLCLAYAIKTNYGGMMICDLLAAILAILVLAGRDGVTVNVNKALHHVPLMKYAGFASLGIYIFHMPILQWLTWAVNQGTCSWIIDPLSQLTPNLVALILLVAFFILCIPVYFIDKYGLKRLGAWVMKITKANEPIVLDKVGTV